MGQVYRALDELLRRRVALKLLHASDVTRDATRQHEALERVLREARMAAALDHPNVVSIFDVGENDGVAYIVMEHVLGRSLRSYVNSEVPIEMRAQWLADVARALSAAHRAGLVHRDIKPENVMVRNDGVVKVLDFGIARQAIELGEAKRASIPPGAVARGELPAELRATIVGTIENGAFVGTPGYMPPELMLRGESDSRSDQFAWAVMAFEVLAAKMPWSGGEDASALISGALFEEAPPLGTLVPTVSERMGRAIDRALAKDPAARFETMDALLEAAGATASRTLVPPPPIDEEEVALAATAASGPLMESLRAASQRGRDSTLGTAPPAITVRPADAIAPRSPRGGAWALGGIALLGAITGGVTLVRTRHPDPPRLVTNSRVPNRAPVLRSFSIDGVRRLTFDEGCEEFPSFTPDGRSVIYDGADGDDYHVFVLDTESGSRRAITHASGWQFAADRSPDGRTVAYIARAGSSVRTEIMAFDGSGAPRAIGEGNVRPRFTIDGRCVWGGAAAGPGCFDVATGASLATLSPPPGEALGGLLDLGDGRVLARALTTLGGELGRLRWYDREGHNVAHEWDAVVEEVIELAPDRQSVIVARVSTERQTQLWDVPVDGTPPRVLEAPGVHAIKGFRFSPRGDRAVWSNCGSHSDLGLLAAQHDGSMRFDQRMPERDWADMKIAAVPGTSLLAVVSDRRGQNELWIVDRSSRQPARPVEGSIDAAVPAASRDGAQIAFSRGAHGIAVAAVHGSEPAREVTHESSDTYPTFAADGTHIYYEARVGDVSRVMSISLVDRNESPRPVLPPHTGRPSMSPNGLLAYTAYDGTDIVGLPHVRVLATGADRLLSRDVPRGTYSAVAFSADGSRAALTDLARQVFVIDVASGRLVGRYQSGGEQVTGVAFANDGIVVTRGLWNGDLWLGNVTTR